MNKHIAAASKRGQGLVEMAMALPVLLILLIGVVEIGFALRSYLIVVNATREGARFAARGQSTLAQACERIVIAGGVVSSNVPFLRTGGDLVNTGIIISRMEIDQFGSYPVSPTYHISGFIPHDFGGGVMSMTHILPEHSWISTTEVMERHSQDTAEINATRQEANMTPLGENIVVVEVFYSYHPLWNIPLLPLPDPWLMYNRSMMREAW